MSNGTQNLAEGDYARLEVIDTGCGMTEEVKSWIFDPFFTTKFSGRGLGLSAVQGIIRSHGGALRVESVPDQGSRFVVRSPQATEPLQRDVARTASAPSSERTFSNGTALVVEDENNLRTAVSKSLRKRGLSVIEASDGNAAIHLFKATPCIDLVLLDMTLPGMSGTEVLAELRKIRPDVKVILTTAYSREMAMSTVGEQCISEFIRKPYLISDLFAMLHKVMSA